MLGARVPSAQGAGDWGLRTWACYPRPKRPQSANMSTHSDNSSLTFVDLFAGIGGMRLGFEQAGFRCVFSCERDKWAQKTYISNFGDTPWSDINDLTAAHLPDHDVLVAGFPCQPFSIAGVAKKASLGREHGFRDEGQGRLFFKLEELIREKQPKAFVLENVRGLATHNRGRTLGWILRRLRRAGYENVSVGLANARGYVPQNRVRLFIVGLRDNAEFEFPPFEGSGLPPRLRDILEVNPDPRFTITDRLWAYLPAYAERHRQRGNGFGFGLADLDGATRTLSARYHKDGAEILIPQEGKNPRRLTPTECRRLMGFPEEFKIVVSNTQAYRQFGNSVVVPVVAELAARVKEYLDGPRTTAIECPLDETAPLEVGTRELPGLGLAKDEGSLPSATGGDDGAADPGRPGRARLVGVR